MPITVSISRGVGSILQGALPGKFDIFFPDGSVQTVSQTYNPVNKYNPAIATCSDCIGGIDGFITNACPSGQTFNYSNLLNRSEIGQISAAGITSFDSQLTGFTGLVLLSIGSYCSSTTTDGSFPFILAGGGCTLPSFSTILPPSSYGFAAGRPGSIFIFSNNTVNCAFNPIFQTRTSDNLKWVFTFKNNNAQESLTINAEHICNVNIFSNSSLTNVIINNLKFQNYVTNYSSQIDGNSNGGLNISNNISLTNIQVNDTNLDVQTSRYQIIFVNNNLSQITFNENSITYPLNRDIYIYLGVNNFSNFTPSFTNPKVYLLDISSQRNNVLTTIPDTATLPTQIREFNFSTNNVTQCPYLPSGILKVNMVRNPITCTADRPNFRTSMTDFTMGGTSNFTQSIDISAWQPNAPTTNNETLVACTSFKSFKIEYSTMSTWAHQFAATMTDPAASLSFQFCKLSTVNMSLLSGFKTINLSNQRTGSIYHLQSLSNLHSNTTVTTLDLSTNSAWSPTSDNAIIQGQWPSQLRSLTIGTVNNIVTWNKSFANFATSPSNATLDFRWYCNNPASTSSVSFIIRDIITGTTRILGTLVFGDRFGGVPRGMEYPVSSQDQFTKDCLTCLTASTITPCPALIQSSNALPANLGRGFSSNMFASTS